MKIIRFLSFVNIGSSIETILFCSSTISLRFVSRFGSYFS